MIITRPSGLFASVLPTKPSDSTSVVFTITNDDPPRAPLQSTVIPTGIEKRKRPNRIFTDEERRETVQEFRFTVKENNQYSNLVSGNDLFSYGQVLGFSDERPTIVETSPSNLTTEHDTHIPDSQSTGLDNQELSALEQDAVDTQKILLANLETLQKRQDQLKAELVTGQKTVNEINRVLKATNVILDTSPGNSSVLAIKDELEANKAAAIEQQDAKVAELSSIPAQIQAIKEALRSLADIIN